MKPALRPRPWKESRANRHDRWVRLMSTDLETMALAHVKCVDEETPSVGVHEDKPANACPCPAENCPAHNTQCWRQGNGGWRWPSTAVIKEGPFLCLRVDESLMAHKAYHAL